MEIITHQTGCTTTTGRNCGLLRLAFIILVGAAIVAVVYLLIVKTTINKPRVTITQAKVLKGDFHYNKINKTVHLHGRVPIMLNSEENTSIDPGTGEDTINVTAYLDDQRVSFEGNCNDCALTVLQLVEPMQVMFYHYLRNLTDEQISDFVKDMSDGIWLMIHINLEWKKNGHNVKVSFKCDYHSALKKGKCYY